MCGNLHHPLPFAEHQNATLGAFSMHCTAAIASAEQMHFITISQNCKTSKNEKH